MFIYFMDVELFFIKNPDLVKTFGHTSRILCKKKFDIHEVNKHICKKL